MINTNGTAGGHVDLRARANEILADYSGTIFAVAKAQRDALEKIGKTILEAGPQLAALDSDVRKTIDELTLLAGKQRIAELSAEAASVKESHRSAVIEATEAIEAYAEKYKQMSDGYAELLRVANVLVSHAGDLQFPEIPNGER